MNASKYAMLRDHWTFLPFYYCDYTFLKLAEICYIVLWWSELHLSLVCQNKAEGSPAWSHHRTKRQKMSRTFLMYFVWPFKLYSWKHFHFLTCKVVWTANLPHRQWEFLSLKCTQSTGDTLLKGDIEVQCFSWYFWRILGQISSLAGLTKVTGLCVVDLQGSFVPNV